MDQERNILHLWTFLAFLQTLNRLDIKLDNPQGIDRLTAMDFAAKWSKK